MASSSCSKKKPNPKTKPTATSRVEEYLDSLPASTTFIDLVRRNISHLPSLDRFTNLQNLNLYYNRLVDLPRLPQGLRTLYLSHVVFESLPVLPSSVTNLRIDDCAYMRQMTAPLPAGLILLHISDGGLLWLPDLPPTLGDLKITNCKLRWLPALPSSLSSLNLTNNELVVLPELPPRLNYLYISQNPITRLPMIPPRVKVIEADCCRIKSVPRLPPTVSYVCLSNNPLYHMVNAPSCLFSPRGLLRWVLSNTPLFGILYHPKRDSTHPDLDLMGVQGDPNKFLQRLATLNRFRDLFYALKFKRSFRDWLWVRVRLPKIERANHPVLLQGILEAAGEEEQDLEDVLSMFGEVSLPR